MNMKIEINIFDINYTKRPLKIVKFERGFGIDVHKTKIIMYPVIKIGQRKQMLLCEHNWLNINHRQYHFI